MSTRSYLRVTLQVPGKAMQVCFNSVQAIRIFMNATDNHYKMLKLERKHCR
jgi:hypothetical protein